MVDIFISYSRKQRVKVQPIKAKLESYGLVVFFDVEGIDGGDRFPDVIDRAVKGARAVLGCWSERAFESDWVKAECRVAKRRGVLVPVAIEAFSEHDVPTEFDGLNYLDLTDFDGGDHHEGWIRTLRALGKHLKRDLTPAPTNVSPPPAAKPQIASAPPPASNAAPPPPALKYARPPGLTRGGTILITKNAALSFDETTPRLGEVTIKAQLTMDGALHCAKFNVARDASATGGRIEADAAFIQGHVQSNLSCAVANIGETGALVGTLRAEQVLVSGKTKGQVRCRSLVVTATGDVEVDEIVHQKLEIADGAHVRGRVRYQQDPLGPDQPSTHSLSRAPFRAPAAHSQFISILSRGVTVIGNVSDEGTEIQVDGAVYGSVRGRVVNVTESGLIHGELICESATIDGIVEGIVRARTVRLNRYAKVRGDILHGKMTADPGAILDGNAYSIGDPLADSGGLTTPKPAAPSGLIEAWHRDLATKQHASILSKGVQIDGAVFSAGEIQIDGGVKGAVYGTDVTIGDLGLVTGDVWCRSLFVHGQLEAHVRANRAVLTRIATVRGDIEYSRMTLESGAVYEGQLTPNDSDAIARAH